MFRTATAAQHTNGSAFGISFERTSFEKITLSDGIIRPPTSRRATREKKRSHVPLILRSVRNMIMSIEVVLVIV